MCIVQPLLKTSSRWNTIPLIYHGGKGLVKTTDGRKLITKGYANLPLTAPGLGY
jgi:hypothetical protein